ncbi:MAG TPA: hypothetical protein DDW23_07305, partial [Planctomycetes bacterium]|nr:hypothetical protein [Planctomycetota bacterium]
MPISFLAIACVALLVLGIGWFAANAWAKVLFVVGMVFLVGYSAIGSLHAWGESQDLTATLAWCVFGVVCLSLGIARM